LGGFNYAEKEGYKSTLRLPNINAGACSGVTLSGSTELTEVSLRSLTATEWVKKTDPQYNTPN